jgi:hypothetical protein
MEQIASKLFSTILAENETITYKEAFSELDSDYGRTVKKKKNFFKIKKSFFILNITDINI